LSSVVDEILGDVQKHFLDLVGHCCGSG
jgi:hypothetical protein